MLLSPQAIACLLLLVSGESKGLRHTVQPPNELLMPAFAFCILFTSQCLCGQDGWDNPAHHAFFFGVVVKEGESLAMCIVPAPILPIPLGPPHDPSSCPPPPPTHLHTQDSVSTLHAEHGQALWCGCVFEWWPGGPTGCLEVAHARRDATNRWGSPRIVGLVGT